MKQKDFTNPKRKRKIVIFLLLCTFLIAGSVSPAFAQQTITIKGKVTDSRDGSPLPGVNLLVKGTAIGTITNEKGEYKLDAPDNATLVFSFIGMKTQETEVNGRTNIDVALEEDISELEEVVTVGYGTAKKKDLTGSVSQINIEKLESESTSNVTDLLRGSIPGLNVSFSASAKGLSSPSQLEVRGQTSMKNNAPLIIVDGMIYYGDLSDINPQDIERIDVLKDASSAAIYGSRATNGVILITKKKGKKGKPVINFNASLGLATLSHAHYDAMNGPQFIDWRIAGFESNERHQEGRPGYYNSPDDLPDGVTIDQWKAYDGSSASDDLTGIWLNRIGFSPLEIDNYKNGKTVNWKDYEFQNGLRQNYNISISGATDRVSYYWSLGRVDNEGIVYNEKFSNTLTSLNLEAKVTDFLKVGTDAQLSFRDQSPVPSRTNLLNVTPYSSFYEDDGVTIRYAPTGNISASRHPWLNMVYQERFRKYNSINSKIYATIDFPLGFSFTTEFIPIFRWDRNYNHYSSEHFDWGKVNGIASRSNTSSFHWQLNNILRWDKVFNNVHSFHVTLLQNAEEQQYWSDYISRDHFDPNDNLGYHRLQAASNDRAISTYDSYSTAAAYMARLNYSYKSKYLLTASYRRDGYSAFGQKHPWANFGSVALGWVMTEESFFNIKWLNFAKLRLSYGVNGNRGVGTYDALSNLASGKYLLVINGMPQYVSQLYATRMANADLRWERTGAFNLGLDFSLFDSRLRGTIEGYKMKTEDLLISRALPDITGYSNVLSNLGQVNNSGFEMQLSSMNIRNQKFMWKTEFTYSHNRNKIVHLYGNMVTDANGNLKEADDITNEWFIGHAIDEIWDYNILGIWQEDEKDVAASYSRSPGDFKLEDVDNDGYYTNADKQFLGNRKPQHRISLRNEFDMGNWTISLKLYSYLGYFSANNHRKNNDVFYDRGTSYNVPYWTPAHPSNKWARIESYETGFNVWENNSFLRVDNFVISYNIPSDVLTRVKIQRAMVSVVAQNPLVWSPSWTWMDPEHHGYTPSYFSFKLNLTL